MDVYKISLSLIREIYKATSLFPKEEQFILTSQIKRAAISVVSNIAVGASRISKPEKKRFYEIARSSLVEIDSQFEIAINLNYYKKGKWWNLNNFLNRRLEC